MVADLWNAMKQRCEDVYRRNSQKAKEDRRRLTFFDLTNEITELRRECPEWQALPAVTMHRVAKQLTLAFDAFFRRCRNGEAPGYPRWRAREKNQSIPLGTGTRTLKGTDKKTWKTGWRFLRREDNPLSWALYYGGADLKDMSTWIHARGRFPTDVNEFNNADIIWRDGKWLLSVCVEQNSIRFPGRERVIVRMDTIDCFAIVNDMPSAPDGLIEAQELDEQADRLKAARDGQWQRPPRHDAPERSDWNAACAEISRVQAKAKRIRHNALHVWTSRIVGRASDLTIIVPPSFRDATASARGDEKEWGANTAIVAKVNRHVLNQAPATARAMLEYKAAEAGIRCDIVIDNAPNIAISEKLIAVGKQARRTKRLIKQKGKGQ
jgi:putative transposase